MAVSDTRKELFETMSVPRAVATLAIPTIISQIVTMIYNVADTFFIGQMGDPYMVAAVTLVYPWFNLFTALGNLFGIGGSSLISRLLGAGRRDEVRHVSAFSFYGGMVVTLLFSVLSYVFRRPLLTFLGASAENYAYAENYLFHVILIGGLPTMLNMTMAHMLRSEGQARMASFGMMAGGILNMILDPLLIFGLDWGLTGAAAATAASNYAAMLFFLVMLRRLRMNTSLSLNPRHFTLRYAGQVFSVGLASALATTLANVSNMTLTKLAAGYGDLPVAACGIVKKVDMMPINVCMGLCQGFMPLVGYNYASGNYRRMKDVSLFSWKTALVIAACFMGVSLAFAPWILRFFIREEETARMGANFLRIACLSVPTTTLNFLVSYTLQAMGKGAQSAALTSCRQGVFNVPLLIVLNLVFGLYGLLWTQLVVDVLMLPLSLGMYIFTYRRITRPKEASQQA